MFLNSAPKNAAYLTDVIAIFVEKDDRRLNDD